MTLNWVRTKEHFWRERENNITGEILLMLKCPLGLHIKPSLLNVERCPSTAWPSLVIYKVLGGKFTFKFNPNILRLFGKCIKTSLFIKETDVATFWTSVGKFKLRLNATSTGHTVWGTFARWTVVEGEKCIKERERESIRCTKVQMKENLKEINLSRKKQWDKEGCRHSSVDSSAPPILLPWVQVPSTPSTLLSIYIWIVSCGRYEIKQKEAGIGPLPKKETLGRYLWCHWNQEIFIYFVKERSLSCWPYVWLEWNQRLCSC